MSIVEASNVIKNLYRSANSSSSDWETPLQRFNVALELENDPKALEQCVLEDQNWELHVEGRLALLYKAKLVGVTSENFLKDYFGYLAAHLDPGLEKENAGIELDRLLKGC